MDSDQNSQNEDNDYYRYSEDDILDDLKTKIHSNFIIDNDQFNNNIFKLQIEFFLKNDQYEVEIGLVNVAPKGIIRYSLTNDYKKIDSSCEFLKNPIDFILWYSTKKKELAALLTFLHVNQKSSKSELWC